MKIDRLIEERNLTKKCISLLNDEVKNLPNGRLECHVRKYKGEEVGYNWYVVKNKNKKYLPKFKFEEACALAYKRKAKSTLESLKNELMALDIYIGICSGKESKYLSEKAKKDLIASRKNIDYRFNPEIERLAALYNRKKDSKWYEWMHADYFNYNNHPEELTVKSKTGRWVRSRIEASIDESLSEHGLYYRYEDPMILMGETVYPDFTIIDPKSGNKIIWEHFGKLHEQVYRRNNKKKIMDYIESGYYPNLNLIITSEAPGNKLNLQRIESIIKMFFE